MDTLQLDQNVSSLVRAQKKRTHREEGVDPDVYPEWVTVPSLLDQLRDACQPGQESGAGGGSDLKSPVALNALDLLVDITATAREFRAYYTSHRDTLEGDIQAWSAHCRIDDGAVDAAERITSKWVTEIENLFDPPKRQQVKAHCPECGQRYVYKTEAGETVRSAALTVTVMEGGQSYAECGACGTMWDSRHLNLLADVVMEQAL